MTKNARILTQGQRAYEARRAAKAGMSLEKWLASKEREAVKAVELARKAEPKPARKPGFFGRLIEKAHRPL